MSAVRWIALSYVCVYLQAKDYTFCCPKDWSTCLFVLYTVKPKVLLNSEIPCDMSSKKYIEGLVEGVITLHNQNSAEA